MVVALDWRAAEGTKGEEEDENGRRAPGPKQKRKSEGKGKLRRCQTAKGKRGTLENRVDDSMICPQFELGN